MIDVGVAAHITAASVGGPRFDSALSDKDRIGAPNGIWLCQNCAKLIDSDVCRFTVSVLRGWKLGAEWEAKKRLGKTNIIQSRTNSRTVTELKRCQKLRDDLHKAMLKSSAERMKRPLESSRPWKFAIGEFVVHRLGDTGYPVFDEGPGISNWFKLETFDFYNNGIEGILNIEYALGSKNTRKWSSLKNDEYERCFPHGFTVVKVFQTGKIPWRNIQHVDLRGDNFYNCPHFYCLYADNGMPYEGFGYYMIPNDNSYEFELPIEDRVDLDVLLSYQTNAD